MKAIETRYAGCLFRSRLEARWAVFFDTLGIEWQYEPEGFQLSDGRWYLPDFRLIACGTWIEVKGSRDALDIDLLGQAACDLPNGQGEMAGSTLLMILGDIPRPAETDWGWPSLESHADEPGTAYGVIYGFGSYHKNERPWWLDHCMCEPAFLTPTLERYEPGVPAAYAAARSARFEYGQVGAQ